MCGHQFAGVRLRREQRELAAQHGRGHQGRQTARVLAGRAILAAAEPLERVVHVREMLAVAHGADDEMRQRAREVEPVLALFGIGDALRTLDDVRGVLPGREVEREQHVGVVGVGRAQRAGDRAAHQVLAHDEVGELARGGAQASLDDLVGDQDLRDDAASAAEDAVDGGRLLVGAEVARDRAVLEPDAPRQDALHEGVRGARDHVVPGCVAGPVGEAHEEQVADDLGVRLDEAGVPAAGRDHLGQLVEALLHEPRAVLGDHCAVGDEQHRSGHAFVDDDGSDAALDLARDRGAATDRRP